MASQQNIPTLKSVEPEMRLWWNPDFKRRQLLGPTEEIPLLDQLPAGPNRWLGDTDREFPAYYLADGTWKTPDYVNLDGTPRTIDPVSGTGLLSFPGVSFTLPTVAGDPLLQGQTWEPGFFGSGFSPREVKGHYLEAALFGDLPVGGTRSKQQQYYQNLSLTSPTNIGTTGLVIRERRWQQRPMRRSMQVAPVAAGDPPGNEVVTAWNYYWPGTWLPGTTAETQPIEFSTYLNPAAVGAPGGALAVRPIPRPAFSSANPSTKEKLDYVQYLCSQFTVLFCGRNITAPFFGQILSANHVRDFRLYRL